jgi:membrane-bound lytic murein transglycosylase B
MILDLVNVIQLQDQFGPIYYITYPNFQVITTYNKVVCIGMVIRH